MTTTTNTTDTDNNNAKLDRINSALDSVITTFENGTAPAMIAMSLFDSSDKPCARWSFLNQLIVGAHNTADARTFKQWLTTERVVKKGTGAFYIFSPIIKKKKEENDKGETVETMKLRGYKMMPVFRVENTEGADLPGPKIEDLKLPFMEKALAWNINVRAEGFSDLTRLLKGSQAFGVFRHRLDGSAPDEIILATASESVFFHELSHAAQARINNIRITREQHELYEVVAEFSAAVLCEMTGISSKSLGNSYAYVKHYAGKAGLDLHKALNLVLTDVKSCLNLILHEDNIQQTQDLEAQDLEADDIEFQTEACGALA